MLTMEVWLWFVWSRCRHTVFAPPIGAGCAVGVVGQCLPVGAAVLVADGIIEEILLAELARFVGVVGFLGRKAGVAAAKLGVRDERFDLLFLQQRQLRRRGKDLADPAFKELDLLLHCVQLGQ